MATKLYQFYCEICNYKRLTDGTDIQDLQAVLSSPIPAGVPHLDPVTKKLVEPKPITPKKKFKCPQCGRVIKAKQLTQPVVEQEKPKIENALGIDDYIRKMVSYESDKKDEKTDKPN